VQYQPASQRSLISSIRQTVGLAFILHPDLLSSQKTTVCNSTRNRASTHLVRIGSAHIAIRFVLLGEPEMVGSGSTLQM
jgi:hypothetical protein